VTLIMVDGRRARAAKRMAQSVTKPSLYPDLWWLALGPLIVVGVLAVAFKTQMASVWGMSQWFAIVPLWLAVLERAGFAFRPMRAIRTLASYWLIVLVATTTVGYLGARHHGDDATEPRAELAAAAHALWNQRFGHDVPIAAGSIHEAQSIVFYGAGSTRYWEMLAPQTTPWLHVADLRQQGALFVCGGDDPACIERARETTGVMPVQIAVRKHAWGRDLPARNYALFVVPPDGANRGDAAR
jgi:hypothetical protein